MNQAASQFSCARQLLPVPTMFIAHLEDSTPEANGQSDLRHRFAHDHPTLTKRLLEFAQVVIGYTTPPARDEEG